MSVGLGGKLRAEAPEFEPRPSRASGSLSSASGDPGFGLAVEDEVDMRGDDDGLAEADLCRRATGQDGQKNGQESTVSGTCRSGGLVYLPIRYRDRFYRALLDTGCEHSVVGANVRSGLVVEPGVQPLYAENGTAIPIVDKAHVEFTGAGRAASVEMCVSEAISEIILGHDWLRSSGCMWDFRRGRLVYGDVQIPLLAGRSRATVRCIYAAERIVVPARSQVHVPVCSVWNGLPEAGMDWAVEPANIRDGVMLVY